MGSERTVLQCLPTRHRPTSSHGVLSQVVSAMSEPGDEVTCLSKQQAQYPSREKGWVLQA